jgi:probable F420-dependent oxidoreductase
MRFSLAETMCDPAQYAPLARAAEEAGFHAYTLPDSVAYPRDSDSKYPYTPDGNRQFLENKPFIDPLCLASALGMVTQRLRFHTFVVKLPIRHPVLVAKQLASVAVLTGDRFSFGIGLSPWPEDYAICGVPWEGRGQRMDDMISIIRGLLTGEYVEHHGAHFDVQAVKMCPATTKPVPFLIGGHAEPALKRAVTVGDGWMHAGGDTEEMIRLVRRVRELRRELGREQEPFEIHVASGEAYSLDGVKRLEELGVTDAIVGFRRAYEVGPDRMPLEKKLSAIKRFGETIIAACAPAPGAAASAAG